MASAENLPERYLPQLSGLIIPDEFYDDLEKSRDEALVGLVPDIGRAAALAQHTWPKSIHEFTQEDAKTLIRTKLITPGNAGACLSVTVNRRLTGAAASDPQIDIYDYVLPASFSTLGFAHSHVSKAAGGNALQITSATGPVLQKKDYTVTERSGSRYAVPWLGSMDKTKQTPAQAARIGSVAEALSGWLQLLSVASYESRPSRGI